MRILGMISYKKKIKEKPEGKKQEKDDRNEMSNVFSHYR